MAVPQDFTGKVALVVGGSLGIGAGASERLARGGASIMVTGRRQEHINALVNQLSAEGLTVAGTAGDASRAADVERVVRATVERFGGIDILVNSQGIQTYGTVVETTEELWDRTFDTNVKSMYLTAHFAIPEMVKRGGGVVVNVSSVQGLASQQRVAAYSATKGAINALTRAMALDHAADGVRVVAVLPGSIDTPMLRHSAEMFKGDGTMDATLNVWGRMHPLGRIGTAAECAELIAFLASDRASFCTGAEYRVDGGLLAAIAAKLPDA